MKFIPRLGCIFLVFALISGWSVWGKVGDKVSDFALKNVNGKTITLSGFKKAKGFIVIFTCNHCPFAKRYEDRLNTFSKKYTPLGFPLVAISSTDVSVVEEDNFEKMVKRSKERQFRFPYLFDSSQDVARSFQAKKTPHAFVVVKEGKDYVIKYSGCIDDNGDQPDKVIHHYLTDAVDALLAGRPVVVESTHSIGCAIKLRN